MSFLQVPTDYDRDIPGIIIFKTITLQFHFLRPRPDQVPHPMDGTAGMGHSILDGDSLKEEA
jgi:hypothetical protein